MGVRHGLLVLVASWWVAGCGSWGGESPPPLAAGWQASERPELRHRSLTVAATEVVAEVFEFDLRHFRMIAATPAPGLDRATVATLRREQDAWLMVNGTFFDEQGRPLGLLQGSGPPLQPLRRADWGVFEVSARRGARLIHTRDYVARDDIEFAVQCGPRVVIDGRVPSLKPQVAQRTALCIRRGPTDVAVVVTRGRVDATELATWMAADPATDGLGCRDAVLLDGGPSTQLSARSPGVELDLAGGWPVPNGVGVVPRRRPQDAAQTVP